MKAQYAIEKAFHYGATDIQVQQSAELQLSKVGTVPFNNMIKALQMHPWLNTKSDWIRLAGALQARNIKKRK